MLRLAAGFLAGVFTCIAAAQDDAVIVNATRFPQDVRSLPASVTVITRADIDRTAARTLPELLNEQTGFTMKDLFGNNAANTFVDLRGFGATGPQNTLILLDGRRLNDFDLSGVQWSAVPLSTVERIEILRGTGAVLYGDNASMGIVNIISRSPLQPGRSLDLYGRVASYQTIEGQLGASAGNERIGVNASIYGYRSDGYRQNSRNEQGNTALNTRWALGNGALDLRLGTDRQRLRLPGGRFVQPSVGLDEYASDRRGTDTPLDHASRDGSRAGLTLSQHFGAADFSAGLDYRNKEQQSFFDQGGFPTFRDDKLDFWSFTPHVLFPVSIHKVIVGADWQAWDYRSARSDTPENVRRPSNRVRVTQDTVGLYVQDTMEVRQGTTALLGWRAERAKYAGEDVADPTSPACFFCSAAAPVRETQTEHAWDLGVRQALSGRTSAFGRIGRSFRFVNAEEIYESNASFAPEFQLLRPQHAITKEIGAEWRSPVRSLRAALFRTDVTDEIHLDPFTTGVGNTNLPPSRRQGVELDGRWQALPTLRLNAGYAYTDAKFLEGTLPGAPFAIGTNLSIEGKTVPLVPRHKLNLGASWDAAPRTRISALLTAVSEQRLDNDEPNTLDHRIPAYAVVDAKVARELGWGRVALTVNNLFNQKYYTYAARSAFTADRYAVYPLPGVTIGAQAEIKL